MGIQVCFKEDHMLLHVRGEIIIFYKINFTRINLNKAAGKMIDLHKLVIDALVSNVALHHGV